MIPGKIIGWLELTKFALKNLDFSKSTKKTMTEQQLKVKMGPKLPGSLVIYIYINKQTDKQSIL